LTKLLTPLLLIAALLLPAQAVESRKKLASTLRYTKHSVARMQERGVPVTDVKRTVQSGEQFKFFHDGKWKTGYYDPEGQLFVSVDGRTVITVVARATRKYIDNLKSKAPPP
jgi:hypothetical protein